MRALFRLFGILVLGFAAVPGQAQTIFSASGPDPASVQPTVDAFRAGLGTLNPNVAGSLGIGRREINWDGVPDALSAPNNLPADFFNVNSPRGVVFSTPGTGFQVSSTAASGTPVEFGNIDPTYTQTFETFSAQRLFTALGSNIVDVNFFIPGSTTQAFTNGFGAVFTDVDVADATTLSFFGLGGAFLGTWSVPNVVGANETLSFLGVLFSDPVVTRVRITSGTAALAPGGIDLAADRVAMDDFIFGEPRLAAAAVPEPGSWAMLLVGFAALGSTFRRRRTIAQRAC
jgi:hypothetical protein